MGLGISRIDIVASNQSSSGLAVVFGQQSSSMCEPEYYNIDAFSYLPLKHDEPIAQGMIDWDFFKVGIFEIVRSDGGSLGPGRSAGSVVALKWQWDQYELPLIYKRTPHSWTKPTGNGKGNSYPPCSNPQPKVVLQTL